MMRIRVFPSLTASSRQVIQGKTADGLADAGLRPEDVQWVINTHLHFDHVATTTFPEGAFRRPAPGVDGSRGPLYNAAYYRPHIARFVNDYWDRWC